MKCVEFKNGKLKQLFFAHIDTELSGGVMKSLLS